MTTVSTMPVACVGPSDPITDVLSQNLEAINMRHRPPHIALTTAETSFLPEKRGTDSGYASLSTTPEKQFDEEHEQASQKPADVEEHLVLPRNLYTRKVTKLKFYDKSIPQSTQNRFDDLNELFGKPLYDYLSKRKIITRPISIKLRVLGESEETARPWIIVMCDKAVSKRVKQFFNQQSVRSEYKPCDVDPSLPQFDIYVCDRPPRLIAATTNTNVYGNAWDNSTASSTLCGRVLRVGEPDKYRLATFGGIIKLSNPGNFMLFGMTAGHVVTQDFFEENGDFSTDVSSHKDSEDSEDWEDSGEDLESEICFSNTSEDFELELSVEGSQKIDEIDVTTDFSQDIKTSREHAIPWSKVGHFSEVSSCAQKNGKNLDWALIKIDEPAFCRPNLFKFSRSSQWKLQEPSIEQAETSFEKSVVLLSGVSGIKRGTLSNSMSYLVLASGKNFVKTYNLCLSYNSNLNAGDCGSWVIDVVTYEVYGHVVASDALGEAYVVPLHATFQDIQKQLAVESVSLPHEGDILRWLDQCTENQRVDFLPISAPHMMKHSLENRATIQNYDDQILSDFERPAPLLEAKDDYAKPTVIPQKPEDPLSKGHNSLSNQTDPAPSCLEVPGTTQVHDLKKHPLTSNQDKDTTSLPRKLLNHVQNLFNRLPRRRKFLKSPEEPSSQLEQEAVLIHDYTHIPPQLAGGSDLNYQSWSNTACAMSNLSGQLLPKSLPSSTPFETDSGYGSANPSSQNTPLAAYEDILFDPPAPLGPPASFDSPASFVSTSVYNPLKFQRPERGNF